MSKTSTGKKIAAAALGAGAAAVAGVVTARALRRRAAVIHVEPGPESWQLRVEGERKPARVLETKDEAVSAGREMAHSRAPSELVIHRADGTEQTRHAYEE